MKNVNISAYFIRARFVRHNIIMPAKSAVSVMLVVALTLIAQSAGSETKVPANSVTIDCNRRFQTIDGFGLNFAGPYFRDDQKTMFDTFINDLGVTMFRVCPYLVYSDWELTNDNGDPEAMNWEYYNDRYSSPIFEAGWKAIRYLNSKGIRPLVCLWGPVPDWMLDSESTPPKHAVCQPSDKTPPLKPSMYPEFAEEVVSMVMYARSHEHLDFQYFSPINESDCYPPEGPRVDPEAMPEVLAAVARRLIKEGLGDIKLAVADQAIITTDYVTSMLKNNEVMKQVGAFTFHTYVDNSVGPQVERIEASPYPNVPVWLTEYGDLNDLDKSGPNDWKSYCLNANRRALLALNQGASALFYFNAFDDYEECGRRLTYYGLFHSTDQVYYPKKRYYAVRQLYHFVLPGSRRVEATNKIDGLTISSFLNPDGSLVIVGVKEGGSNHIQVKLQSSGQIPDHLDLYLTSRSVNCLKQGAIQVRNGLAELDLPDEAVFTLVGPAN